MSRVSTYVPWNKKVVASAVKETESLTLPLEITGKNEPKTEDKTSITRVEIALKYQDEPVSSKINKISI